MLVLDGCGQHVNKGYIYFAMFFSLAVEMLNLRVHKLRERAAQQRHQP
jgi:predicted tellurium resistance membrane protein TerC